MKKYILVAALVFPIVGCNTLRKVFPQYEREHGPEDHTLPDDYTLSGVTHTGEDIICPVRVLDSTVSTRVLQPGATTWRTCNRFEVFYSTGNSLGGSVRFSRQADLIGGYYYVRPYSVAPPGTRYEIRSITLSTDHNLY